MKLAVPDLISNSYFPAVAAVEMGFFRAEGLDVTVELISPAHKTYEALRDGDVDFVGASAHTLLAGYPNFAGGKLLCTLSQGLYWFLIMRTALGVQRGDLGSVRGRRIAAAPWVGTAFHHVLRLAGMDAERDNIQIAPLAGSLGPKVNVGVTAAEALAEGLIDGFWANGMGAEMAVLSGAGTLVLDARRDATPAGMFTTSFPALGTSEKLINEQPEIAAAAIRAITATHAALRADPARATELGNRIFPAKQAAAIADLVTRDLPFYDAAISEQAAAGMTAFALEAGILDHPVEYAEVVATQFSPLWPSH